MIREIEAKSILTKSKLPASDFCINPYVGCSHGCKYCYAKFLGRWFGHKERWGSYVDVKVNAADLLKMKLQKSRRKPSGTVLLGSMTDAYQPAERKYLITRKLLETLQDTELKVSILTKSSLVTRDIDLLTNLKIPCEVGVSISYLQDEHRSLLEPGAAKIEARFETLSELRRAGIATYTFIGPIFPNITPVEDLIRKAAGVSDFIMAEALNVSCGNWECLSKVLECRPEIATLESFRRDVKSNLYWKNVEKKVRSVCIQEHVPLAGFFKHN